LRTKRRQQYQTTLEKAENLISRSNTWLPSAEVIDTISEDEQVSPLVVSEVISDLERRQTVEINSTGQVRTNHND